MAFLILAVLLLFNAAFAMSELAVMTSRPARLERAAARGHRGARAALALSREPTRFLSTVQVGITMVGILAGALGERAISRGLAPTLARVPGMEAYADAAALGIVVLGITYVSLVFGELVPKRLALAYPEGIAVRLARPLSWLSVVSAVPVRILTLSTEGVLGLLGLRRARRDDVSEDDVRALMAKAASTGVFTPSEHDLFQRVFRVGDLSVKSLMVPRADVVWIEESMTAEEVRVLVGTSPFSHFPVCRGSLDSIEGVVHIKDLISHGLIAGSAFRVAAVARKPLFVPETADALRLLDLFREHRTHVAFVVDEFGGTEGLVTLTDLLTALIGDLPRRGGEPAPGATRRADGSWLLDGRLPLHEALAVLNVPGEAVGDIGGVTTVAGLVFSLLGRVPRAGEHTRWRDWELEVVDMDGQRIDKVLATYRGSARRAGVLGPTPPEQG